MAQDAQTAADVKARISWEATVRFFFFFFRVFVLTNIAQAGLIMVSHDHSWLREWPKHK